MSNILIEKCEHEIDLLQIEMRDNTKLMLKLSNRNIELMNLIDNKELEIFNLSMDILT